MYCIYSLTPAPWGDDYRFVEGFGTRSKAENVLLALQEADRSFNLYKIIFVPLNVDDKEQG